MPDALFLAVVVLALAVAAKATLHSGFRESEGNTRARPLSFQVPGRPIKTLSGRWRLAPRIRFNAPAGSGELPGVDRQLAHALPGQLEQLVGQRRYHRRQRRFADAGRRVVRGDELNLDPRRRRHARQLVLVEVARLGAAVLDLDRQRERLAETVDHRTLDLVERAERVDHVAADVAGDPHGVDLDRVARAEARL